MAAAESDAIGVEGNRGPTSRASSPLAFAAPRWWRNRRATQHAHYAPFFFQLRFSNETLTRMRWIGYCVLDQTVVPQQPLTIGSVAKHHVRKNIQQHLRPFALPVERVQECLIRRVVI